MTKFYFSSTTGSLGISPAFQATWVVTGGAVRRPMSTAQDGSPIQLKTISESSAINNCSVLNCQYISQKQISGTHVFSGFIRGQVEGQTFFTGSGTVPRLYVWLANSGGQGRSLIFNYFPESTSNQYQYFYDTNLPTPPQTGTKNVTGFDGDYIVAEVGFVQYNSTTNPVSGGQYFGATGDSLPIGPLYETSGCPWIEFEQNFPFR